jgi:hypothetical protein
VLLAISFQDFKSRSYFSFLLIAGFTITVLQFCFSDEDIFIITINTLVNLLIIGLYYVAIWLYVRLRFNSSSVKNYIAEGDWLFFVLAAFWFSTPTFLFALPLLLVLSLVIHLLLTLFQNYKIESVPLAGLLALQLAFLFAYELIFDVHYSFHYDDNILLCTFTI